MSKPFFYKITAADFAIAVMMIPPGKHEEWVKQLASDLVSGEGNLEFSKKIISEVSEYREKQSSYGKLGGRPSHKGTLTDPKGPLTDPLPEPTRPLPNSSSSNISSTEKEKNLLFDLLQTEPENPSSPDGEGHEHFYLTYKGRKLAGKKLEAFEQFWDAFGYKSGRAKAADSWLDIKLLSPSLVVKIVAAARDEAKRRPFIIAKGDTPIMAQGWLSGRRWEDEKLPLPNPNGTPPRAEEKDRSQFAKAREMFEREG